MVYGLNLACQSNFFLVQASLQSFPGALTLPWVQKDLCVTKTQLLDIAPPSRSPSQKSFSQQTILCSCSAQKCTSVRHCSSRVLICGQVVDLRSSPCSRVSWSQIQRQPHPISEWRWLCSGELTCWGGRALGQSQASVCVSSPRSLEDSAHQTRAGCLLAGCRLKAGHHLVA